MSKRYQSTVIALCSVLFLPDHSFAWHNPQGGRFLQPDPVATGLPVVDNESWFHGKPPQLGPVPLNPRGQYHNGLNLYQYVGSNPINWNDPLGLYYDPFEAADQAIVGVYRDHGMAYATVESAIERSLRGNRLAMAYTAAAFLWDQVVWDRDEAALLLIFARTM